MAQQAEPELPAADDRVAAGRVAGGPGQRGRNGVADDFVRLQPGFARGGTARQQQCGKSGEGVPAEAFSRKLPR